MKKLLLILTIFLSSIVNAQSNIIINNNANIVMTGTSYIVQENPNFNSISKTGTSGGIIMQSENPKLLWKIGTSTGIYTIPFGSSYGNTIPFVFNITSPGTGSGYYLFNSYETSDNNTPYASGITAMNDNSGMNNTLQVIDRFWIVSNSGYTTTPTGTYNFTYDDNDLTGNFITETDLSPQRWNSTSNTWGDWVSPSLVNATNNNVTITPDQYSIWTLSNSLNPLPIKFTNISAIEDNKVNNVYWTTATEENTWYHTIQKSFDGSNFIDYKSVSAAGNSNVTINYSDIDDEPYQLTYYRIKTTDFDGQYELSPLAVVNRKDKTSDIIFSSQNGENSIFVKRDISDLRIFNVSGQEVIKFTNLKQLDKINVNLTSGVYIIKSNLNTLRVMVY